jgi:DNA mismatch endonuclease, patch repair protein
METLIRYRALPAGPLEAANPSASPPGPEKRSTTAIGCSILFSSLRTWPQRWHRIKRITTMPDIVDKATRSRMMGGIRGKTRSPNCHCARHCMHAVSATDCTTRAAWPPDLVFPKHRAVCFVHGCFWHRHPGCRYTTFPATRPDFWNAKFAATVARDERNRNQLIQAGWRVAVVWECSLRGNALPVTASRLADWLQGDDPEFSTDSPTDDRVR